MKRAFIFPLTLMTAAFVQAQTSGLTFRTTASDNWNAGTVEVTSQTKTASMTINTKQDKSKDVSLFEGFGTCFNELGDQALRLLSSEDQEKAMKGMFDPEGDLRFVIGRIPIGASDYGLSWYSLDETDYNSATGKYDTDFQMEKFNITRDKKCLIPYIHEAQALNPNMTFWASPWSPPQWMKTNQHYAQRTTSTNGCPFSVAPYDNDQFIMEDDYLNAYVLYFQKTIDAYGEENIPITALSYQNEAYSYTPYPGCSWTAAATAKFLGEYLGPQMKQNDKYKDVRLLFGTCNTNHYDDVFVPVLAHEGVQKYMDIISLQWEGGQVISKLRQNYPQYTYWQTESECGGGTFDWGAATHTFQLINHYLANGCTAYTYWNAILKDGGYSTWGWKQNSLIQVNSSSKTANYTPEYYAMKHYSHFIAPGSRILAADESNLLLAAQLPTGEVVVVAGNTNSYEKNIVVNLDEEQATLTLPANSMTTYYFGTVAQKKATLLAEARKMDTSKWIESKKMKLDVAIAALDEATDDAAIETAIANLTEAMVYEKSTAIPSKYYSTPADGLYYLYSIDQKKFVKQSGTNGTTLTDSPEETVKLTPNADGTAFSIQMSHGLYAKLGSYGNTFFWTDSSTPVYWTFEQQVDDTYLIYSNAKNTSDLKDDANYYINTTQNSYLNAWKSTNNELNAFALISEANYDAYLADNAEELTSGSWQTNFTTRDNTTSGTLFWDTKTDTKSLLTVDGGNFFPDGTRVYKKYYGLPNMTYSVSLKGYFWTAGKNVEVYVSDGTNTVSEKISANKTWQNHTLTISATSGYLEIGVRTTGNTDGSMGASDIVITPASHERSTATGEYGTICLPYDAKAEGCDVYSATLSGDHTLVILTKTDEMQEGVSYIYKATADSQTFSFVENGNIVTEPVNTGCLKGLFEDGDAPGESYTLQTQDGMQAFYRIYNGTYPLAAYNCYLEVSGNTEASSVNAIKFYIEGEQDAIKDVQGSYRNTGNTAAVYNISGQRLAHLQRGVNVVDGSLLLLR